MANKKRKKARKAVALVREVPYSVPVRFDEIKRRREKLGLSMKQAAERMGWKAMQSWSGFERGDRPDPQVSTMVKVAAALECSIDDLLTK